MRSPRILMISTHGYVAAQPELGRPDTGGQVVYVLELSKALAARGFEVDIVTRQFSNQPTVELVSEGVEIVRVPYAGSGFRPKETLARFVPEFIDSLTSHPDFRGREYDLINSHYWDAGVAGVRLSKLWSVPHIHTPHSIGLLKRQNSACGSSGESESDHLDERIQQERVIYHRSDLVVSTAAQITRSLNESDEYNVPEEKIAPIPPGFDDALFYRSHDGDRRFFKQLLGWAAPTVFAAGRLTASKGYDLLLQAFPAILNRIPNAQLVLAIGGTSPTSDEEQLLGGLKQLARQLEIADHVTFTTCVDQVLLADYYRAADVFVLSSRNEPFGMAAIESMACGTPTVVTTRGGLWEELTWGQDCIYCDPLDSDALAQAICSPLQHPKIRQQLSHHGAATARSRYTWHEIAGIFVEWCADRRWLPTNSGIELMSRRSLPDVI